MKKIFIAFLLLGCVTVPQKLVSREISIVDYTGNNYNFEQLKKEVWELDRQKEYKLSYQLMENCLLKNYSLNKIQYAIEHAEKHFEFLHKNNTIFAQSSFIIPSEKLTWKDYVVSTSTSLISPILPLVIAYKRLDTIDKINLSKASGQKFPLPEKNTARLILEQYDLLKKNMLLYLNLLEQKYSLNLEDTEKDLFFTLKSRLENLKQRIIDSRCNFVSYHVISPVLAETSKLLYLATFKWLELDDKQKIQDAAVFLARSCHHDWVYTSSEDVRIQFCNVVKEMKNVVRSAEWEEFEVLTTLLDSNDPSKKRGAATWWEDK